VVANVLLLAHRRSSPGDHESLDAQGPASTGTAAAAAA